MNKLITLFTCFVVCLLLKTSNSFAEYDGLFTLESNTAGIKHVLLASEANGKVSIVDFSSGKKKEVASADIEQKVHGACEFQDNIILALGSSLKNQTAPINIIELNKELKNQNLIVKKNTGRAQVTHLQNLSDKIYLNYFTDTYNNELVEITKSKSGYEEKSLYKKRMAVYVSVADSTNFAVARPYGDKIGENGDAYIVNGKSLAKLDTLRGGSTIHFANIDSDSDREVIVADGWHQNYGKIAEARLTLFDLNKSTNKYEKKLLVNDPMQFRFENIDTLAKDSKTYILASGNKNLWFFTIDSKDEVSKKIIAKKANPRDALKGEFLGVKDKEIFIAVLNKDISLAKEAL